MLHTGSMSSAALEAETGGIAAQSSSTHVRWWRGGTLHSTRRRRCSTETRVIARRCRVFRGKRRIGWAIGSRAREAGHGQRCRQEVRPPRVRQPPRVHQASVVWYYRRSRSS
ncbi:unnamed protein product [Ectocarpus fasciculatus]